MLDSQKRFLFVTGKGGVGKTTASVALARAIAENGRRVLLTVTEPVQVPSLLGLSELPSEVTPVDERLSVCLLQPEAALRQYGELVLHSRRLHRALFENRYSRSFLAAIPGLYPWALLGKAWFHASHDTPGGPARFDCVVFDAPATGHGLEMLRVPKVISEAATPGILKRDADAAWRMFQDHEQTGVVVVTLPEELPVQESLELTEEIEQLGLRVSDVVVNAERTALLDAGDLRFLEERLAPGECRALVDLVDQRLLIERTQEEQLQRLSRSLPPSTRLTRLPWLLEAQTPAAVARLVAVLRTAAAATGLDGGPSP